MQEVRRFVFVDQINSRGKILDISPAHEGMEIRFVHPGEKRKVTDFFLVRLRHVCARPRFFALTNLLGSLDKCQATD